MIAVLPVNNLSQDITMPVLMRYFMEKEADDNGFKLPIGFDEVDRNLRRMGITDGSQINEGNVQNVGQYLKVDGILQSTLLESRRSKDAQIMRADFRLVSVHSGQVLWEKKVELEENVGEKIPVRGAVSEDWNFNTVKMLAKSSAGKLPHKLVKDALKSLKP